MNDVKEDSDEEIEQKFSEYLEKQQSKYRETPKFVCRNKLRIHNDLINDKNTSKSTKIRKSLSIVPILKPIVKIGNPSPGCEYYSQKFYNFDQRIREKKSQSSFDYRTSKEIPPKNC